MPLKSQLSEVQLDDPDGKMDIVDTKRKKKPLEESIIKSSGNRSRSWSETIVKWMLEITHRRLTGDGNSRLAEDENKLNEVKPSRENEADSMLDNCDPKFGLEREEKESITNVWLYDHLV